MHKNAIKAVWGVKNYGTFWKKIMCAFFVRVSVGFGKIGALLNSKVLGTLFFGYLGHARKTVQPFFYFLKLHFLSDFIPRCALPRLFFQFLGTSKILVRNQLNFGRCRLQNLPRGQKRNLFSWIFGLRNLHFGQTPGQNLII